MPSIFRFRMNVKVEGKYFYVNCVESFWKRKCAHLYIWTLSKSLHQIKQVFSAVLLDQKWLALVGYLQGLPSGIAGDWPPVDIPLPVCWPDNIVSPRLLLPVPAPAPCKGEEWWEDPEDDNLCWWARFTPSCSANSRWSDWCT